MKRVVASTLAGETLALSAAIAEAEFLSVMYRDALFGDVDRKDWRKTLSPMHCVMKDGSSLKLPNGSLSIVDAKSIFDVLQKDCSGSKADRRTSIELSIIRESMSRLGSSVRWVPHQHMPADALTHEDPTKHSRALI